MIWSVSLTFRYTERIESARLNARIAMLEAQRKLRELEGE